MRSKEQILSENYSAKADELRKNRMLIGYYRYGGVKDDAGVSDWLACAEMRIKKYLQTGNTEWLLDAMNYHMMEFMYPQHPKAHFKATDHHESPGKKDRRVSAQDKRMEGFLVTVGDIAQRNPEALDLIKKGGSKNEKSKTSRTRRDAR